MWGKGQGKSSKLFHGFLLTASRMGKGIFSLKSKETARVNSGKKKYRGGMHRGSFGISV
jgi:hypothetical protein